MATQTWQAISGEIHANDRAGILIDSVLTEHKFFEHGAPVVVSNNLDNHFRKGVYCAVTGILIAEAHVNDLSKIVALGAR
jgi:hypothetical protein